MPEVKHESSKEKIRRHVEECARLYEELVDDGELPETARDVFPLATAQVLDSYMPLNSWRNVFKKRTDKKAQKEHRHLMTSLLIEFKSLMPNLFFDIEPFENDLDFVNDPDTIKLFDQ